MGVQNHNSDLVQLTVDIQQAIEGSNNPKTNQLMQEFLTYMARELPVIVRAVHDHDCLFHDVKDAVQNKATCKTLYLGVEPGPKQSRGHQHGPFDLRF